MDDWKTLTGGTSLIDPALKSLSNQHTSLLALAGQIKDKTNLEIRDITADGSVGVGNVVYLDTVLSGVSAKPASAMFEVVSARLEPAREAIYTGVVTSLSSGRCTISLGGMVTLTSDAVLGLFGTANPTPGIFYLGTSGKVVSKPTGLKVPALYYLGDGVTQIFQASPDLSMHDHRSYLIPTAGWADVGTFTSPPAGATKGYSLSSSEAIDNNLTDLVSFGTFSGVFLNVAAGTILPDSSVTINTEGIWWNEAGAPPIIKGFFAHTLIQDPQLVYSVSEVDTLMKVSNKGGHVVISQESSQYVDTDSGTGKAITLVDGKEMSRDTVINNLTPAGGITISTPDPTRPGDKAISLTSLNNVSLESSIINLDSTVTLATAGGVFTTFPANRAAAVSGSISIPEIGTGTEYKAYPYFVVSYSSAGIVLPKVEVGISDTVTATGTVLPSLSEIAMNSLPGSPTINSVYMIESTAGIALTGKSKGYGTMKLSSDSAVKDLHILGFGINLKVTT